MNALPEEPTMSSPTLERPKPHLSKRELEVMRAWFASNSKSEAAGSLYLSLGTVNTYLTRIRAKYLSLGRPAGTKAALVARAIEDGLIDVSDL
ncbi:MAG: LuxR C-terminal-related transcriptional regulator [Nocardiaceae bacterium]|nr:LuxR C-terminal-related transcriptional regulator [Nocardiaceae bacterium]